jgi:hypothetical protein
MSRGKMYTAELAIVNTRLPVDLHRDLKRVARDGLRSVNAEIIYRLRESIKNDTSEEATA